MVKGSFFKYKKVRFREQALGFHLCIFYCNTTLRMALHSKFTSKNVTKDFSWVCLYIIYMHFQQTNQFSFCNN